MKSNTEQLAIAKKYVGYGGSKFRKFCGLPSGSAWCDAYVTTIFAEAGNASLFCNGTKQTYCPTTIKWCLKNLASVPPFLALPSDIIFFDWELNGVPNHIGFVRERKDCDTIYTIEGNTSGSICAQKTRNTKYVQGIFRPHFKPSAFDPNKALVVDGLFGYNSIAVTQKALKKKGVYSGDIDGILGQGTVKGIQKLCGASPIDGLWGVGTSKKLQKFLGVTADGLFGKESCKALQRWANAQVFPQQTWVDKANAWARKISNQKYHYVRWKPSVTATHTCPICNRRKYDNYFGWNCIGYSFACWHHGGGLKNKCSCSVISSGKGGQWDRLLKVSQAEANKLATSWVGVPVTVIRNGGKAIPLSQLKAGDICCLYSGGTAEHIIYYMGNGKYSDSNTTGGIGSAKNIRADLALSSSFKSKLKLAIRYNGK